MEQTKRDYEIKPLEDMNVIDNFLFTAIMSDDTDGLEACRIILSCVLKRKVRNIRFTAQRVVPGVSEKSHGIRLDAYVSEISEETGEDINVYDVEPDKKSSARESLPKRSRYYGDLIDIQLLNTGTDYEKLPELVTIFILSYDPFGENAMYYEAGTVIRTHPHLQYNDGIRRIFLYVDGDLPEDNSADDQSIKNLLRYINDSTDENATDDNTRKLNGIVKSTKAKKDIGIAYMKSWEREKELKEEGREEERANTERERQRADSAEQRADNAEQRADNAEQRADNAEQRADNAEQELKTARARIAELEAMVASKK